MLRVKLSLQRYLITALKWIGTFALLELLLCAIYFTGVVETTFFAMLGVINFLFLLLPGVYYLTMFLVFKKRCEGVTPMDGVIVNWEAGFFRGTGAVMIKVKDQEYTTSAYFSQEDAKEMVGKSVSYAVIDDTLFLYEVKD